MKTNSMSEQLETIRLIPDELEFFECKIDHHIQWITRDDPNSLLKNKEMTELDFEGLFFSNRRQDLIQACEHFLFQRSSQFKQESMRLKQTKPPVSSIGAPYQVETREQRWLDREMQHLEAERDHEMNIIRGCFATLVQQCDQRIAHADLRLQEVCERHQRQLSADIAL